MINDKNISLKSYKNIRANRKPLAYINKKQGAFVMGVSQTEIELAIVIVAYLIGITVKANPKISDKWIPPIVGITGGICGFIGFYFVPGFPADNVLNAVAIGIISGLASTGVNQTYKQLVYKGYEKK